VRAILLLTIVYGSLPVILFSPFYGLLVFSWLAYMRVPDYAWLASPERLSLWVALTMFAGLLLNLGRERIAVLRFETVLMAALGLWFALTGMTAVVPQLSEYWVENFSKIILVSILTTGLVQTPQRLRTLLLVLTFSLGLLGTKFGLFGLVRGGANIHQGPGGFMQDNNALALAFAMTLPLLAGLAAGDKARWVRTTAGIMIPFTVLAIVFTFSRGGFLTLGVVGILIVLRTGRPLLAIGLALVSAAGFFAFTREGFQESIRARAQTISEYEEDPSATGRLSAWRTAWKMSQDYPVFGVGPENFMEVYSQYGEPGEKVKVTHNSYLQFLSESGWPAVILYAALFLIPMLNLERMRHQRDPPWLAGYASGIQISMVGYGVGSLFLDMAYFDLFYHLVAISVCLDVAAQRAVEEPREDEGERPAPSVEGVPWWKQAPASRFGR
jgi:probable O-glycosylation ligase (exosortase A-associated)